jgi:N-methylhydantoinase B
MGARPGRDGLASVSFPYNVRDVSVEWSEMETPIIFEKRELVMDSGGAGQWRGGLAEELVLRGHPGGDLDVTQSLVLSGSAGRMRNPAQGLFGGRPGSVAAIHVGQRSLAATASPEARIPATEPLRFVLPGGGGYGEPSKRDPALVARDVKNGYVSPEAARKDYGDDS